MKRVALVAFFFCATQAAAQSLNLRALFSYEQYNYNGLDTNGFRQNYDFHLTRGVTDNSRFHIFFRGDMFQGTISRAAPSGDHSTSRQLQPGVEYMLNSDTILALVRSEVIDLHSTTGRDVADRNIKRSNANLTWAPVGLPVLQLLGQRMQTDDSAAKVSLTDQNALASLEYEWHGLHGQAQNMYSTSADANAGYSRKTTFQGLALGYAGAAFNNKLTVAADASTQFMKLEQSSTDGGTVSVPNPVIIRQMLYSVDDSPTDGRDHPPQPNPALADGDLNTSAGISLGPEAVSFQNLILDLGGVNSLDLIRVVVRDPAGNPLRRGGGPVTFDAYTSADGVVWTILASEASFNAPLSLYEVSFTNTASRWFKVVSFGVNSDPTLVTEVQAFYHTIVPAGQVRNGNQDVYTGTVNVTYQPVQKLTLAYSGLYNSSRQDSTGVPRQNTDDLEHLTAVQWDFIHNYSLRGEFMKRTTHSFLNASDGADRVTGYLDYTPTRQLRMTLELGNENQTLDGVSFSTQTHAIHATAYFLRSLSVQLDAGTQTQVVTLDNSVSDRRFATLTSNAQLSPSLRMLVLGTLQTTNASSSDPAAGLLGPTKDNRISDEFIYRPGRELSLGVRVGWVSGEALSGFTQRYHVEWFPFADGSVSIGTSYDDDIDPTMNRRAKRGVFNPRWQMNQHASLDFNYTMVSSTIGLTQNQQQSFFATLTLSR